MHRLFIPKEQFPEIAGTDVHYVRDVLRMKVGDEIELLDGSGKVYFARIDKMSRDKIICKILENRKPDFVPRGLLRTDVLQDEVSPRETENQTQVAIAQCLPKARKMDLIIQKCTELGAIKIIPVLSERSVAKIEKLERWRKIAKEAAEQCSRTAIPEITPLIKFADLIKTAKEHDLSLIPWELEKEKTLKQVLKTGGQVDRQTGKLLILIGPEGGFSQNEIKSAKAEGFIPVSLGKRVLRTETAGMATLSMINYEFNL